MLSSVHEDEGSLPTGRPVAAKWTLKRSGLVAKAAELFGARGYHRTTMADIAAAAGIQKPSLYHYFESKQDLLFWLHEEYANEMLARVQSRQHLPMDASHRLLEAMTDILDVIHSHRGHVVTFWENRHELGPEQERRLSAKRALLQRNVEELIQECVDTGKFRQLDVKMATFAIFGTCSWAYQWYEPGGRLRSRDVAYIFWDFFVNGFDAGLANP
jgi:TetR/AcrR family transcriptional regulator, cholesterol catabolism regulator